jgi:hypothetical protein
MSTELIVSGEAELLKHQREMVAKYAAGLPWNIDHYTALIRDSFESAIQSFLRTGSLLLVAKAHLGETGGEWQQLLADAGIPRTTAWQMMRAAETVDPAGLIQQKLPKSKVAELLSLSDSELKELDTGGKVDGKDVDDIARMTRAELRAWRAERDKEIRDLQLDLEASRELARNKSESNERLQAEVRKLRRQWQSAKPDEQIEQLRQDVSVVAIEIRSRVIAHPSREGEEVSSLRTRAAVLVEAGVAAGIDQTVYLAGVFAEIERDLRCLRDELGVPAAVSADPTPDWLRDDPASEVR